MGVYENAKLETRKKIIQSFWELYKTTNIEKITVKDITDASGIYRTTFYLHFSDIYAILERIEEYFLQELHQAGCRMAENKQECRHYMDGLTEMLRTHCDHLNVLVNEQKNPRFAEKYKKEMVNCICLSYQIDLQKLDERARVIIQKTLSSVIDLFFGWVDTKMFSFEEMVAIIDGYMGGGVLDTFQKEINKAGNTKQAEE